MATINAVNTSLSGQTGTGQFVGDTSPTLVTPVLGVAEATSINKVALTEPATGSTLTIAEGKTLEVDNTMTLQSTDSAVVDFGAGGTVLYGATGLTWSGVAGTTQTAAANSGYVIENASQTTVTLPDTAALGDVVAIAGLGAAGWVLTAGTGQTIQVGSAASTTAGTVTSSGQYDQIEVVCVVADTTWVTRFVLSSGVTVA
jgi:hypothetical protein